MNRKMTFGIIPFLGLLSVVWILCIAISLRWNLANNNTQIRDLARMSARSSFEKDLLYRQWNVLNGEIYGTQTIPNDYLDTPERDILTLSGVRLSKINPAYMTRQVHELARARSGEQGHITSLRPIRPQNAPDDWERTALTLFEQHQTEHSALQTIDGNQYMRLMKPLMVEPSCMSCHMDYQIGQVAGGISISIPMAPLFAVGQDRLNTLWIAHGLIGMIGLTGLVVGGRRLNGALNDAKVLRELNEALNDLKVLHGLIPICASCKKIRDDQGYYQQIEQYISAHSEAEFTHGICPDCAADFYPDVDMSSS